MCKQTFAAQHITRDGFGRRVSPGRHGCSDSATDCVLEPLQHAVARLRRRGRSISDGWDVAVAVARSGGGGLQNVSFVNGVATPYFGSRKGISQSEKPSTRELLYRNRTHVVMQTCPRARSRRLAARPTGWAYCLLRTTLRWLPRRA